MNWVIFGVLWGASVSLRWLYETPQEFREKLFIWFVYTAVAVFVGLVVPAEHTSLGLVILVGPLIGEAVIKAYYHRAMEKVYE